MRKRIRVIGLLSAVVLVILAILAILLIPPKWKKSNRTAVQPSWPAPDWRTSTPEEQGFDSTRLSDGLLAMQKKGINIDSLLILRDGAVLLDGHDLRDLTQESLARHIGMVTQESYLFHDTLRNNLLYARPEAADAELEAACRAANIHDFIVSLPDQYETQVGERGYRLSGGEKQRVAIARVILKDPRVLILDEATSHLDSQSEALIQQAMELVMRGRTSLVIAHRLSTVIGADLILVMEGGQVVEQGRHADLLARGRSYAGLYNTQFNPQGSREASPASS